MAKKKTTTKAKPSWRKKKKKQTLRDQTATGEDAIRMNEPLMEDAGHEGDPSFFGW